MSDEMARFLGNRAEEYATPQTFVDYVEAHFKFKFTLDAAADESNSKAPSWIDIETDSLIQKWSGHVWLNPPYGRKLGGFIRKAILEQNNCKSIWVLIPARTDNKIFHELINPHAFAIYLIKGRFNFIHPSIVKGANSPSPSMLVHFRPNNRNGSWITTLEPSKGARGF